MTGILRPFNDDIGHMPHDTTTFCTNLRPLDFSNLLGYNDPVLPATASPQNPWATIMSPLCSASRVIASPKLSFESQLTQPFHAGSPLFDSFSPLFRTPRANKTAPAPSASADFVAPIDAFFPDAPGAMQSFVQPRCAAPAALPPINDIVQPRPTQPPPNLHPHTQAEKTQQIYKQPRLAPALPAAVLSGQSDDGVVLPHGAVLPLVKQEPSAAASQSMGHLDVKPKANPPPITEQSKPEKKLNRKSSKSSSTMSSIDKAAERRRKNRESSSRCYYNRKRIIETLDRQISEEKTKLTTLYDRALELRHENARLKKDVVTNGIALPTKSRPGAQCHRPDSAFQLSGYLHLLQTGPFQPNY